MSLLLLLACAAANKAVRVDPAEPPVLPSPRATVYTRAPATPRDPLVAAVTKGVPWDESLSGVATAVALAELNGESVDTCRLRWLAVLAGYPFPIVARRGATAPAGQVPEAIEADAQAQKGRSVDVGLVRARGRGADRWVILVGEPRADLPPIPRELALGDAVQLGDRDWVVSDPLGEVRTARGELRLDASGEWLLSTRDGATNVATLPVYVNTPTPTTPRFSCAASTAGPDERVDAFLTEVRRSYGYDGLTRDTALDSVARARLRAWSAGEALEPAATQLRAAGYVGVPVAAAECRASTVEACLSSVWWSPEGRGVLVGDLAEYGVAIERAVEEGRDVVRMVLVGAG